MLQSIQIASVPLREHGASLVLSVVFGVSAATT